MTKPTKKQQRESFARAKYDVLRQLREDRRDGICVVGRPLLSPADEERDFANERRLLRVAIDAVARVRR